MCVFSILPLCCWWDSMSLWEHSLSLTGRCSSLALLKKTLRGVRSGPGLLPSLLLLRIVCGMSETAVSFYHQGEEEDEEERKMRQTTVASAAVSLRIVAYGLLRAVTWNQIHADFFSLKRKDTQVDSGIELPCTDSPGCSACTLADRRTSAGVLLLLDSKSASLACVTVYVSVCVW